jgi:Holliday junction DNA helicase RuvA
MISMLRGTVDDISGAIMTVDVGGVGYEVLCSSRCIAQNEAGRSVKLIVHTDVREDSIRLFGFADALEKQVFLMLTTVKGMGAKSASDVISKIDRLDLLRAIAAGDAARLQQVKGVGKKTAERILVELKDKVGSYIVGLPESGGLAVEKEVIDPFEEALQALLALGFSKRDAERAVQHVGARGGEVLKDSAEVVREALRVM